MEPLIVILAGGEGSRMGGNKPLRRLGGETLLGRALKRARGWSEDVRIALRSADQVGEFSVPVLLDDPDIWGPLAGLTSGLRAAQETGRASVLTMPCDMPFLPENLPARLSASMSGRSAALASSGGQLHPVCGLWSTAVLADVACYLAAGRRSLKGLAETVGYAAVDWPEQLLANVNTPEELAAAERKLESEVENRDL